jgi:hypothetical protein
MSEDTEGAAPEGSAEGSPPPADAERPSTSPEPSETEGSGEAEGQETEAEAPEEIEFDFGGNKLRVPKGAIPEEVAEQLDKFTKGTWSDYTRKSQEVAERAKALAAEQEVVQKLGTLRTEALSAYAQGLQLRSEIEQLQKVDLSALWQSNPDQARRVSDTLSQKQADFQRSVSVVSEHEARAAAEEQQHVARLAEDGRQKVARAVKGFDEARLIEYATKQGVPEEAARTWPLNPPAAVMAWKAMMYDQLQAKAAPTAKPAAPPAAPVKPIAGKSAPANTDAWMNDPNISGDEWARRRNAQLARRRAGSR